LLTCSERFTHISGHQLAEDRRFTTVLCNQGEGGEDIERKTNGQTSYSATSFASMIHRQCCVCVCFRISTRSATELGSSIWVRLTTTPTEVTAGRRRQIKHTFYVGGRVRGRVAGEQVPFLSPRVQACCMHIIIDNWKPSLRL